ncbi:FMN-binding negative transcriptional regulator [Chitinimonas sp.]|uniref:FMN-binding negative transcriptional regulator n=1 Tax=Chitinimonas sp. TaxID=1934313 RepID=UPI0035B26392
MYLPAHFEESRPELLAKLINDYPLATVIASPVGIDAPEINLVPFLLAPQPGEHGRLLGHVARGNPLAQCDGQQLTVLFHGPNAYITPNWYASKAETGKAVPTWNYAMVEVRARLRCVRESGPLLALMRTLTDHFEADQAKPWTVDEAPADYIDKMLTAIVGLELDIKAIRGKFKLSQNQSRQNFASIQQGLGGAGSSAASQTLHYMQALQRLGN